MRCVVPLPHTPEKPCVLHKGDTSFTLQKKHNHKLNDPSVKMRLECPHTTSIPTRKQHYSQYTNVVRDSDYFSWGSAKSLWAMREDDSFQCSLCPSLWSDHGAAPWPTIKKKKKKDRAPLRDKSTPLGVAALKNKQSWLNHHSNSWVNYLRGARAFNMMSVSSGCRNTRKGSDGNTKFGLWRIKFNTLAFLWM